MANVIPNRPEVKREKKKSTLLIATIIFPDSIGLCLTLYSSRAWFCWDQSQPTGTLMFFARWNRPCISKLRHHHGCHCWLAQP